MAKIICKYCTAENDSVSERCFSCNAPLPKAANLSEKDRESLGNFILSNEKFLKAAKSRADLITFILFLLIFVVWGIISFLAYRHFTDDRIMVIVMSAIMAIVFFLFFGGLIMHFERKAMQKEFNENLKSTIEEYLSTMNFTKSDYQGVAGEVLKEKSALLMFIGKL